MLIWGVAGAQTASPYEQFRQQRISEMNDFREKTDAEFASFLKQRWEEYRVYKGLEPPIRPVPATPTYADEPPVSVPSPVPEDVLPLPESLPAVPPRPETETGQPAAIPGFLSVTVDFFGSRPVVPVDAGMVVKNVTPDEGGTARAWAAMSAARYGETIDALKDLSARNRLNDWGNYMLVKKLSEAIYTDSEVNGRIAAQFFMLCRMGYRAKVCASDGELALMLPFKETIYSRTYTRVGNEDYFIFGDRERPAATLKTFNRDFSPSGKPFSLAMERVPEFHTEPVVRAPAYWVSTLGEEFSVRVEIGLIAFMLYYPLSDLQLYHRAAVSKDLSEAVLDAVRRKTAGMAQREAVAAILSLVQNGFAYRTDADAFGRNKPLFIEESFYYGANNCKDRVLLFSWIVRNVLGLDVAMAQYSDHIACGVDLTPAPGDDTFPCKGRRYVVCDPTYINAGVGKGMPQYKGFRAEIWGV